MALFDWNEAYAVDIVEIDDQHKKLVLLVNQLHDAINIGKGKEVLGSILNELIDYTHYHFQTEEKYFDMYNYPDTDIHKQQHKELVEQVIDLQKKFNSGEPVLTIDVLNLLRDWLNDHIVGSDVKFGPFLKGKGMS